jgi:UDPglucose 6-dehydrogenase
MNIAVVGTGYVGATTCVAFALSGHHVIGVDIDSRKVEVLNRGRLPFYEEGIEAEMPALLLDGRLRFTVDLREAVRESEVIFLTVGTPMGADGSADLSFVEGAARAIGQALDGYKVIVNKSTVPVGTAERVRSWIAGELARRGVDMSFDVVSNPEFLREGRALHDALHPDRVVIGCEGQRARSVMEQLYRQSPAPVLFTGLRDAELTKYAANAFLATKISFVNELARLCERTGARIDEVARGMGLDPRIGASFLGAGVGYGGSCFPKDVQALCKTAEDEGVPLTILDAVAEVNHTQPKWFVELAARELGGLQGKRLALLGLTFKPDTDDIREAPSLKLIPLLQQQGAVLSAYDPKGMAAVQRVHEHVQYAQTPEEALDGADAVLLVTEWREFLELDWCRMLGRLRTPCILDGRNALDGERLQRLGYRYLGVGRRVGR